MRAINLTLNLLSVVICANSARILGISHIPSYSAQQLALCLLQELAERGHEITLITPFVPKTPIPNVTFVEITYPHREGLKRNLYEVNDLGGIVSSFIYDKLGLWFTEACLNNTNVKNLLKSHQQFDLIIAERTLGDALAGFCHHYGAPCIALSSTGATRSTNTPVGNPGSPSYVPEIMLTMSSHMTFYERVLNSLIYTTGELFTHFYIIPNQNALLQKYFPGAPHLYDLYYNTSLTLLFSHVSVNPPVPLVPSMIDIGGYHVKTPKQLPEDLQKYLDDATNGAIYFSMGSYLKSKDMTQEKINVLCNVFSKLKQRVLWKWEDGNLLNRPGNVKIAPWFSQQDVLAHPNIKLFITHGGLLSTMEAIHNGVPLVGIPIFADQHMNMANSQNSGFAITIPYQKLSEETLTNAINEMLNNPKYTENAKLRSKILHDQPMKPLEKAVYWVEYVLRHKGAPHLRTAALHLIWYQYLLLDVALFVILVLLLSLFIITQLVKILCWSKKAKGTGRSKLD